MSYEEYMGNLNRVFLMITPNALLIMPFQTMGQLIPPINMNFSNPVIKKYIYLSLIMFQSREANILLIYSYFLIYSY